MKAEVEIRTAVLNDRYFVIRVARVHERREYHAARRDTEQNKALDTFRAQHHVQIGSGEGAYTMFDYDDIGWLNSKSRVNFAGPTLK